MKNIIKYGSLVVLMLVISHNVGATAKFDIAGTASSIQTQVSETTEEVQAKIKGVTETKKGLKFINAAKEGIKTFKKLKKQATDTINAAQALKAGIEENVETLKESAAGAAFNLAASNAAVLSNLQAQQAQAKAKYEASVKEYETQRDSTVKKHQENIKIYEKMKSEDSSKAKECEDKINEAEKNIEAAKEACKQQTDAAWNKYEEENSRYEQQINALKSAAGNTDPLSTDDMKDKAKNAAMDKAKSLLGEGKNALNSSIAENFYEEEEEENPDKNKQINNYRKKIEFQDTVESYYQAVKLQTEGDTSKETAEDLRSNAQVTETGPAATVLNTSLLVEQMRSMLKYAKLQVASLKMSTARDMVKMPKHLSDYSTIMESDLDVYKKIGKGKLGKSSLLNNVKNAYSDAKSKYDDAKSKFDEAKSAYDTVKSGYEEAKDIVAAAGELADAASTAIKSEIGGQSGDSAGVSSSGQSEEKSANQVSNTRASSEPVQSGNISSVAPSNIATSGTVQSAPMASAPRSVATSGTVSSEPTEVKVAVPQSTRQAFAPMTVSNVEDSAPIQKVEQMQVPVDEKVETVADKPMLSLNKTSLKSESLGEQAQEELKVDANLEVEGLSTALKKGQMQSVSLTDDVKLNQETASTQMSDDKVLATPEKNDNLSVLEQAATIGRKAFSQPTQVQELKATDNQVMEATKLQEIIK